MPLILKVSVKDGVILTDHNFVKTPEALASAVSLKKKKSMTGGIILTDHNFVKTPEALARVFSLKKNQ